MKDFLDSFVWSSMHYFKDNFRNNALIFKVNYFFFFNNYFFFLLIFLIVISHLS